MRRLNLHVGRACAPAALGTAVLLFGAAARAEDAKKVVAVGDGPDGEAVSTSVASRAAGYAPGDSDAFRAALGPAGFKAIGAATKRKDRGADLASRARAAARKAHADRAIVVHAERGKNKAVLVHAWVIDAQGSGPAEVDQDVHVSPGASAEDEADAVWGAVASSFPPPAAAAPEPPPPPMLVPPVASAKATPPVAAASVAASAGTDAEVAPSAAPPGADTAGPVEVSTVPERHTRAGSLASLGVRMEGGSRHFSYNQRVDGAGNTTALRPYDLFVAPVVKIEGDVYPFRGLRVPGLQGLGAEGSFAMAFGLSSQDEEGNHVSTSWDAFDFGLRERLPIGPSFVLGIDAGYGDTSFTFQNPSPMTEALPSVHYEYLRAGLDGRYTIHGDLSISASFGYRDVMSTGDFGGLFPRASVGGVDASLGVAEQVAKGLELSLEIEYARFFYSLQPQPGDQYVAGGALDEMASLSLGLSYLF